MERVTYPDKGSKRLEDLNLQIYQGEIMGLVPISAHGLQPVPSTRTAGWWSI